MVKLLIIDDDFPTTDFLRNFFKKRDYHVFTANDGEEALSIAKEKHPDIVLLDIKMPGLSGIEVLRQLKERDKSIKIIMMTAVKDEAMIELAKKYGASEYITKPFSLDYLEKDVMPKILKQML